MKSNEERMKESPLNFSNAESVVVIVSGEGGVVVYLRSKIN
jgi:hypothetical protein